MNLSASQNAAKVKLAGQLQVILRRAPGGADTPNLYPDLENAAEILVVSKNIEALAGRAIEKIHTAFRNAKALEDWPEAKAIMAEAIEKSSRKIERMEKIVTDAAAGEQLKRKLMLEHGFDPESQEGQELMEEISNHRSGEPAFGRSKDDPISQRIRLEILKGNSKR